MHHLTKLDIYCGFLFCDCRTIFMNSGPFSIFFCLKFLALLKLLMNGSKYQVKWFYWISYFLN
ncbi:uncharacterized protein DS421_15g505450 [Arachis hypogaea]|nr:uncharacterized protein DS421_15g505450 [Arachis hypogaea]